MSTTEIKKPAAILAIIIWLAAPTIYLSVEWYVSRMFSPHYSYLHRFTSDLAIPYAYYDPKTGHLTNSWRAPMMNLNFAVHGFLFLAGQISLLRATGERKLSTARLVIAVVYCIGILLVAAVPGGPREHENGRMMWHGLGAVCAIFGGNINSLLAGFATPVDSKPVYKTVCLSLGAIGFCGPALVFAFGYRDLIGVWQRLSIYPTQMWEYSTAVSLVFELLRTEEAQVKRD
ncbi:hypothetical protein M409DRAFT_48590 [Zasmidium cellare ATCC 36951]|uniref:DUF998 domain-containing protein n=1 Tax=Zasmidium cellare ATCC 36951 TaxID=1080233 RepID=A0A6A6D3L5_ZASCE|nr:uncharacterized protein M409DRAFT_48590 [Zasmidium cellare ATCC 36951]KAF2173645.1 hypothetical protein M409DRAFT_48590 [Zasmidium cellare ATCC 36951]